MCCSLRSLPYDQKNIRLSKSRKWLLAVATVVKALRSTARQPLQCTELSYLAVVIEATKGQTLHCTELHYSELHCSDFRYAHFHYSSLRNHNSSTVSRCFLQPDDAVLGGFRCPLLDVALHNKRSNSCCLCGTITTDWESRRQVQLTAQHSSE